MKKKKNPQKTLIITIKLNLTYWVLLLITKYVQDNLPPIFYQIETKLNNDWKNKERNGSQTIYLFASTNYYYFKILN